MKTRIIASYLLKEGYDEVGDRDIDLDKYARVQVKSIEDGIRLIVNKDQNGLGTIIEEMESKFGWEDVARHDVSEGIIFQTINS